LPQTALPEFEQAWLTPQRADFGAAARLWGHDYQAPDQERFGAVLKSSLAKPGVTVLHLAVDRAASIAGHRALWAAASSSRETSS
jgi:2-succinyl-5-enolpyruvyl-6-hydroxy-3-cyclohexene-1-carboxylate synthase